jgi:RecB family exonuclease
MAARPTEPSPLLYGSLAHHLLALVFGVSVPTPNEATAHAEAIFDRELPALAEALALPDHQAERTSLRRAFVEASRLLAIVIAHSGASLRGLEVPLAGSIAGVRIVARADLVLDAPFHVIDFKWGGSSQRERLRAGTAVQLAIYAALARGEAAVLPGVAYLTLRDQRLLATRGSGLATADEIATHTVEEMLGAIQRGLEVRIGELADQRLAAPGAGGEDAARSRIVDGVLRLAPPCQHCDFDALCGRRGAS